jgi:putative transcriptional regulator
MGRKLSGHLLIASPQMRDPNFHRTVVLIVRDDEDGTLGLVLNRPLELSVKEACDKALQTPCNVDGSLYHGGPCDGPLMVLHAGEAHGETSGDLKIARDVWFCTDKDEIESLLADGGVPMKCFIGYAGWGQGQLDGEMESGAWLTHPASSHHVYGTDAKQWSKLMTQLTLGNEIDPRRIPDDPSVN